MLPLNLPNVLTLLRVLAVPVIVVALLGETPNGDALAAGVFALAALTDGLDGYIARRRHDVTTFGKLMDPLADKVLIIAALVSLVSLGRLAGITTPCAPAAMRRPLTANSRAMITIATQGASRSRLTSEMRAAAMSSLSAIGSITLPKLVSLRRDRAM